MPLPATLFDEMLDHARALPGAVFDVKWGSVRVVSIGGKMFLACDGDGLSYKVADDDFLTLSGLPGARPAPYLARTRWVQVVSLEALSPDDIRRSIERSRELALSKLPKAQRLAWS